MNFKEEIEEVIEQLKKFGFDRRKIEQELFYSTGSIDQTLSRGGNQKMLAALKMLLRLQVLQKSTKESGSDEQVIHLLNEIHSNLIETRHTVELNQALTKTTLDQTGRLESIATRAPLVDVLERLNKVSSKIFLEMHPDLNRTSVE